MQVKVKVRLLTCTLQNHGYIFLHVLQNPEPLVPHQNRKLLITLGQNRSRLAENEYNNNPFVENTPGSLNLLYKTRLHPRSSFFLNTTMAESSASSRSDHCGSREMTSVRRRGKNGCTVLAAWPRCCATNRRFGVAFKRTASGVFSRSLVQLQGTRRVFHTGSCAWYISVS